MGSLLERAERFEARLKAEGRQQPLVEEPKAPTADVTEQCNQTVEDAINVLGMDGYRTASSVLGLTLWIARDEPTGLRLARQTGEPALVVDDLLKADGRTPAEAREMVLPCLIHGTKH